MPAEHGPGILRESAQPLQREFDAALLDLDGVVYRGRDAVPHASAALEAAGGAGMATMFVTNNASRSPAQVAQRLTELAVPAVPEQIVTSAQAAARLIAQEGDDQTRVLAIGSAALRTALIEEGLEVVTSADEAPTVVVQGMRTSLDWRDLAEAVYAINAGADHVATNLDATVPTDRGVALANGSMVAAVMNATGREVRDAGKPAPWIFHQAAGRSGASRPLVVGDRLGGDIAGARAAGYAGLHVLTGVDGPGELLCASAPDRPHYLGADLRALGETHPASMRGEDGWWTCRGAVASVQHGTVRVRRAGADHELADGDALSLDELRAACAAAWSASDAAGQPTVLVRPPEGLIVTG